jgi:CO dehydrogenase maturation factor
MRIGFLGKGGSGKTTLSASFIQYLAEQQFVLAIDADVNVHLANILTPDQTYIHPIGSMFGEVTEYLKGNRTDIRTMVATTPPSLQSNFIYANKDDEFIQRFGTFPRDNVALLTIGTYNSADIGHTCYHGKLNTLETIYHHLLDSENEYIIADATAGIDNLGTSLFFSYDLNVFVVEPTLKSIQVYLDFKKIADSRDIHTVVIVNKCEQEDEQFVQKYIDKKHIIGYIPRSVHIRSMEQGNHEAFMDFVEEQKAVFASLQQYISSNITKDWEVYYRTLLHTHKQNSIEWWNDYYKESIDTQCDNNFTYAKVLTK